MCDLVSCETTTVVGFVLVFRVIKIVHGHNRSRMHRFMDCLATEVVQLKLSTC